MYGGGGWYCASVYDQTVPLRESSTSSNSSLKQLGFLQNVASRGKEMVPQDLALRADQSRFVAGGEPTLYCRRHTPVRRRRCSLAHAILIWLASLIRGIVGPLCRLLEQVAVLHDFGR